MGRGRCRLISPTCMQLLPESLQSFDLNLDFTEVSDFGKRTLPAHPTDLRRDPMYTKVTDSGVQGLVQLLPESLQKFHLKLGYTKVSDLEKRMLPAHLTDLHLNIRLTEVNVSGVQGPLQLLPESLLKFDFDLAGTKVSDLGKRTLPAHLTDLHLNLGWTEVDDSGVQGVLQSLPESLQTFYLSLYNTKVSDLGKRMLPAHLTDLHLNLVRTEVDDDIGVQGLMQSLPEFLQKFDLDLEHTKVTDCGVQGLVQLLPESLPTARSSSRRRTPTLWVSSCRRSLLLAPMQKQRIGMRRQLCTLPAHRAL